MGRGKALTTGEKRKKPKTEIQRKREERKAKKNLPRPQASFTPHVVPKLPAPADPKVVRPKPKAQNPGFMKWAALFKRELTIIETHIKHSVAFQQHWRAEMDKMEPEERARWESGEIGNWVRLEKNLERSREILALSREANAWIVPKNKLGLKKQGLGMEKFPLSGSAKKEEAEEEDSTSSEGESDSDAVDTDEKAEAAASSAPAPAEFVPLNIGKKSGEAETSAAKEAVEPNPYFVVDTNPTPVDLNGTVKKSKKRALEADNEIPKATKKSKREKAATAPAPVPEFKKRESPDADEEAPPAKNTKKETLIVPVVEDPEAAPKPEPKAKAPKVDLSSIETQLLAEIDAGLKAKQDREAAKLAKKDKKRKRASEGDSAVEVKKPKKDKAKKTKRKAEDSGEDELDDEGKKKHKVFV